MRRRGLGMAVALVGPRTKNPQLEIVNYTNTSSVNFYEPDALPCAYDTVRYEMLFLRAINS